MTRKVTKSKPLPIKIGFLGGGQLARMMALEAHQMGLEPHVFSESQLDPAAQVTAFHTKGNLTDFNQLQAFVEKVDLLTFESEFVPAPILERLESLLKNSSQSTSPHVFPRPQIMRKLQNRLLQKQLLTDSKIPTAPFRSVQTSADLNKAWQELNGPYVLKKNFGGYDGYGTFFARKSSDLKGLSKKLSTSPEGFIAEKFVSFKRELASILIRNSKGEMISLPLVETFQADGRCDWVRGPISHPKWKALQKSLFSMLKKLDYVGCLGVEMFDTGSELWVNELAPRVHNSGHYSQDALAESQFALHLKAGLGMKLSSPVILAPQFVMTNLLGAGSESLKLPEALTGHVHLYGKSENRLGRKMGHLNYLGKKGPALLQQALRERKKLQ